MKKMTFAKEEKVENTYSLNRWKVLIVDDEEEVHQITKAVLSKFEYENQKIQTFSAYSGKEAIKVLKENSDIALILLDVVMESDDAGLKTVKIIRNELKNNLVRIILRTGQPGSAPEQEVIRDYDINDYKEKTELTSSKLYTSVISSLRSYKDISIIEQNRKGLKAIIESSSAIFQLQTFKHFAQAVLEQLLSLMEVNGKLLEKNAFSVVKDEAGFHLLAASGTFKEKSEDDIFSQQMQGLFERAIKEKSHINEDNNHIYYFETKSGTSSLFYFVNNESLSEVDTSLIDIFSINVSIAFENINLNKNILDTQENLIKKLDAIKSICYDKEP